MKTTTILKAEKFKAPEGLLERWQSALDIYDEFQATQEACSMEGWKRKWHEAKEKFASDPMNTDLKPVPDWPDYIGEQQTRLRLYSDIMFKRHQATIDQACVELIDAISKALTAALRRRESRLLSENDDYGIPTPPTPDGLSLALSSQIAQLADAKKQIEAMAARESRHGVLTVPPLPSICGEFLACIKTKGGHSFCVSCSHNALSSEPNGLARFESLPEFIAGPLRKIRDGSNSKAAEQRIDATLAPGKEVTGKNL